MCIVSQATSILEQNRSRRRGSIGCVDGNKELPCLVVDDFIECWSQVGDPEGSL